jgi:hypothetical protein
MTPARSNARLEKSINFLRKTIGQTKYGRRLLR